MKELIPQYKLMLVREKEIEYSHKINSVDDAVDLIMSLGISDAPEEHVYLLCLDVKGKIISIHEVSHGMLSSAPISIRALFSRALLNNSAAIIVTHNHPSGDPAPSAEDLSATERISSAGELLEIPLLDHIIIGADCYFSMKQNGHL